MMDLLLLTLFLLGVTTIAAMCPLPVLVTTNATMITCIPLLGGSTFTAFGYTSDLGSIFFAVVMYGMTLNTLVAGAVEARKNFRSILFALMVVFGSIFLLEDAHLLGGLFDSRTSVAGAAVVSFWLAQTFLIALIDRLASLHLVWRMLLVTVTIDGLAGLVFFPCAFGVERPAYQVVQIAVAGWITTASIALLSVPFLFCFLRASKAATASA